MLNISSITTQRANTPLQSNYREYAQPTFESSLKMPEQYRKIGLAEGTGLLIKGIGKQIKSTITSIFEHPIKTLAVGGGTTLGIMALPIIGIPAAVGGSALALGFAGLAVGKGAYHTMQFLKNNENGTYDIARQNLEQIGGDTVDLALSAPFVPKAIKTVKEFATYGKIAYNPNILNELKSAKGLKGKTTVIKNANSELVRKMNYSKTVDAEIAKLQGLTETEAAKLKKDLLEFNVPADKVPEVTLQKWAEIKGISTKPDIKYGPMAPETNGFARRTDCSITLNDGTQKTGSSAINEDFKAIKRIQKGNLYEYEFMDKSGNIVKGTIDKTILDEYNVFSKACYDPKLSPQAKKILTTVHEREHLDQFTKIFAQDPNAFTTTARGKELYTQMLKERGPLSASEAAEVNILKNAGKYHGKPWTEYLKDPLEVGARKVQFEAFKNPTFQKLENVFKTVNTMNNNTNYKNILLMNGLRAQSAAS